MAGTKLSLINDLIGRTQQVIQQTQELAQLQEAVLEKKPTPEKWSAIECLEHLNLYGDFYLPEIRQRIAAAPKSNTAEYKSSWLGNYFANSVSPIGEGLGRTKLNTMNTFKDKNPDHTSVRNEALKVFLKQQGETLELLNLAKEIDLAKTKTSISISKLLKLRMGDTFRVLIYHNQRHLQQAFKAVGK